MLEMGLREMMYRLLELDLAVDKYGLRALGCIVEACFLEHYVVIKNVVELVEFGNIVYDPNRHINQKLRENVLWVLGRRFDTITNSPDAWSMLRSNQELLMATIKEVLNFVKDEVKQERSRGEQKLRELAASHAIMAGQRNHGGRGWTLIFTLPTHPVEDGKRTAPTAH